MDFRIGYRRPLRTASLLRKQRLRVRFGIAAGVVVVAAVFAMRGEPAPAEVKPLAAASPAISLAMQAVAPASASTPRPVYPYSIVPGGVATRDDLVRRVAIDDVVARHYASFDIKHARATTVAKARAVHVSYRKGDKVYWTARTVMLAAGETVLTDGHSEIRGRCGNRISDAAQLPVAMSEPSEQELDASMNVAMDADDAGGTQNVSFEPDSVLPSGSPTQYAHLASFTQPDAATPTPFANPGMPAMPSFAPGGPGAIGLQPTRFLTVSSGPTVALGPTTEGATTVTPDAGNDTSAAASTPLSTTPAIFVAEQPAGVASSAMTPVASVLAPVGPVALTPAAAPAPAPAPAPALALAVLATSANAATPATAITTTIAPATTATVTPAVAVKTGLPEGDIPEPGTLWLSGLAFAAMLATGRRHKAHNR